MIDTEHTSFRVISVGGVSYYDDDESLLEHTLSTRRTDTFPMSDTANQNLADLPPSAKLVFVVIDHEEPLTQAQLVEETRLSARTVRYALGRLKEINAVSEQICFMDARQMLYTTTHSISSPGPM